MPQLEFFTRSQISAMRDPTKARNYSASRADFRRDHDRRRRWGLKRRHAQKLCRLQGCSRECAEVGLHDECEPIPPLIWEAGTTRRRPAGGGAPGSCVVTGGAPAVRTGPVVDDAASTAAHAGPSSQSPASGEADQADEAEKSALTSSAEPTVEAEPVGEAASARNTELVGDRGLVREARPVGSAGLAEGTRLTVGTGLADGSVLVGSAGLVDGLGLVGSAGLTEGRGRQGRPSWWNGPGWLGTLGWQGMLSSRKRSGQRKGLRWWGTPGRRKKLSSRNGSGRRGVPGWRQRSGWWGNAGLAELAELAGKPALMAGPKRQRAPNSAPPRRLARVLGGGELQGEPVAFQPLARIDARARCGLYLTAICLDAAENGLRRRYRNRGSPSFVVSRILVSGCRAGPNCGRQTLTRRALFEGSFGGWSAQLETLSCGGDRCHSDRPGGSGRRRSHAVVVVERKGDGGSGWRGSRMTGPLFKARLVGFVLPGTWQLRRQSMSEFLLEAGSGFRPAEANPVLDLEHDEPEDESGTLFEALGAVRNEEPTLDWFVRAGEWRAHVPGLRSSARMGRWAGIWRGCSGAVARWPRLPASTTCVFIRAPVVWCRGIPILICGGRAGELARTGRLRRRPR